MDTSFNPQGLGPNSSPTFASVNTTGNDSANSYSVGFTTVTTSTAMNAASSGSQFVNAAGGAVSLTLPAASAVPGRVFSIKKLDAANNVTITAAGSDLIDGTATKVLSTQYTCLILQSFGTGWYILSTN